MAAKINRHCHPMYKNPALAEERSSMVENEIPVTVSQCMRRYSGPGVSQDYRTD